MARGMVGRSDPVGDAGKMLAGGLTVKEGLQRPCGVLDGQQEGIATRTDRARFSRAGQQGHGNVQMRVARLREGRSGSGKYGLRTEQRQAHVRVASHRGVARHRAA